MLLKPYQIIKNQLITIEAIKLITWFNNQIQAGTLHTAPVALIEFPDDLNPETLNRQQQQAELVTRVHLVSKIHSGKDGSIDDTLMQAHELLAQLIYDKLHGYSYEENNEQIINSLDRVNYGLDMNNPGWAITTQDFECLLYQPTVTPMYIPHEKPPANIIPDNSRAEFIRVISPNGEETLTAGDTYLISWDQFLLSGKVKIELTGGGLEDPLVISEEADGRSFEWDVPEDIQPGSDYLIRIESLNNSNIYDASDEVFEIAGPEYIQIVSPNGGESWLAGESYSIQWQSQLAGGSVTIKLLDRNIPVLVISNHAIGQEFNWAIPSGQSYSRDYAIEISRNNNPAISDRSDTSFTINALKK